MYNLPAKGSSKVSNYKKIEEFLPLLIDNSVNKYANLANIVALLNHYLTGINWVGFYLVDGSNLVVGPFQGLPACTSIAKGRGVCGTAWATGKVQLVKDVTTLSNHIACDANSKSEIVVPLFNKQQQLLAVLDIDAPEVGRFDEVDQEHLVLIGKLIEPIFG